MSVINRNSAAPIFETLADAVAANMRVGQMCIVKNNTGTDGVALNYEIKANGSGGIAMANGNELYSIDFNSVSSISVLPPVVIGNKVNVTGYHASTTVGGGVMVGKSARHDGVINFDPDRVSEIGTAAYYVDSGVDADCWVRLGISELELEMAGTKGDFDPLAGTGTDDRAAIQAVINLAMGMGGAVIKGAPFRHYYLGTGYTAAGNIGAQVVIGDQATANSANNIHIETKGSIFYQGAAGRAFLFANANNCSWKGLYAFGYTGGALGSTRENDAVLMINKKCKNIEISHHYLTNSLGDSIIIQAAVDEADGGLGNESRNIEIHSGTMKERFGDGVASFFGGTRSREAVAVIVGEGINIHDNIIYGSIDLEPNLTDQRLVNIDINSNILLSGHVTPQASVGTDYWHDEPTAFIGGSELDNDIKLQGVAGAPIIKSIACNDNLIERGRIIHGRNYEFSSVLDNVFDFGVIICGADTVLGSMRNTTISGNVADNVYVGSAGFIDIAGQIDQSIITDNILYGAGTCLSIGSPSVGPDFDQGNIFRGNKSVIGSNYTGTILNATVADSNTPLENTHFSELKVFTVSGTSITIDWSANRADCWYIQQAAGTSVTVSDISNSLGDGQLLEVMAEASGGGSLTLLHSASVVLKGSINAVLSNTNAVTLRRNFGRWVEVSRNF